MHRTSSTSSRSHQGRLRSGGGGASSRAILPVVRHSVARSAVRAGHTTSGAKLDESSSVIGCFQPSKARAVEYGSSARGDGFSNLRHAFRT